MKPRAGKIWLTIILGLCGFSHSATAQRVGAGNWSTPDACASGNLSSTVAVHAPERGTPFLSLCDGHPLGSGLAQSGQPVALASADFDGDGVPDLVSGFATGKTGKITIHRGNVNALWPYGAALRNGPPPAFLSNPRSFALPEAPDFLVTGDFNADGYWDVVTAQRGSDALYLLKGDGHGGFRAPQRIPLGGSVTAMIAGEINRADGLADLIVAISSANGARALVYESPSGALAGSPEIFKLSKPATSLALSKFDGNAMNDLAVASGNQLVVIHARDRKLSLDQIQRAAVPSARVTVQNLSFNIQALVAGDFAGAGPSVAGLGDDGKVHVLEHIIEPGSLAARMASGSIGRPTMQLSRPDKDGNPVLLAGSATSVRAAALAAIRESLSTASAEWTERSSVALPSGFSQTHPHLTAGRLTGSLQEDLIAVDSSNSKVHILSTIASKPRASAMRSAANEISESIGVSAPSMKLIASLDAASAPSVVLPMRLNRSGLSGLVVQQNGQAEPTVMPQDIPPANVFTVTNTSDAIIQTSVATQVTGPEGSLRAAIFNANQAAGTSSIVFNIPTTDPGYNPTTGAFLIQPLSQAQPGALNDNALDSVYNTTIIDGYTQPGASPNTLANGGNARLLIQIDGGKATTPGGSGMTPFLDVGSVFRGLIFTGWTKPDITTSSHGSTASGAEGIEAGGVQDYIEGNFFGVDSTGKTAAPNRIGIFADAGPGLGSTAGGNIIGGTTPQARNILSGNNNSGVLFLSTAYEAQLQGNFVGLDATGKAIVSNPQEPDRSNTFDGAGLNGSTVTIGGTLPGAANVIAGNGTNVDINDLTEGGAASDSLVQGNLIGTDATGKIAIPNQGYGVSILHNPTNMLIGGTTPAARNIISGNLAGVYVFDNSFNNLVQGNYIGADITGTTAVPNIQQGFLTGATASTEISAGDTTIGGSTAGAGNLISGNALDGILISDTSNGPTGQDPLQGNFILGNMIGTDATGKKSVPNNGNGILLNAGASSNVIGGSAPGSSNLIANNKLNGVLIDPGTGSGNNTVANIIQSNSGSGVRINSGTGNRISQNSISSNGDLGINLQGAGANLNSNCNASNGGANKLQNAPSLTAGSGSLFITATATDPNGNTSEFSNAVKESLSGNVVDLLGNFNSTANTTYTIEFFSSTAADPSGYGEGQTYLTSTSVTTGADCSIAINDPVDTAKADMAVKLAAPPEIITGPDYGADVYTGTVTNNGAATAHDVVFTDTLPAGLSISSMYCNVGPCQTPVASTLGTCTVSGQVITCNLGTMATGASASITIPVQATQTGSLVSTATVHATEADPNLTNNTAVSTAAVVNNFPFIDSIQPTSVLVNAGSFPLTVYGENFSSQTAISFNGTALPTKAVLDNQSCVDSGQTVICTGIQVLVPASLLTTAGTVTVEANNPDPGLGGEPNFPSDFNFTIAPSCTYTVQSDLDFFGNLDADGSGLITNTIEVATSAPSCTWTMKSNVPWAIVLDTHSGYAGYEATDSNISTNTTLTGPGAADIAIEPNTGTTARTGTITVAGQTVSFTQDPNADCSYSLSPTSASYTSTGGTGTIASTSGCFGYFVAAYAPWITIAQSSGLVSDNATLNYSVAPNTGAPRTGNILVGADVFTVTQSAPACYYTLDTTSTLVGVAGGTGSIKVTPTPSSCAWTAKSSNSALISVTSGASGTGNGTVNYSIPVNKSGTQTATITIGDANGGSSVFTETQASAFTCTFTVSPATISVSANGISNFVLVNASQSFCKWTAASSDPTALAIKENPSGTGTGAIYYSVAQNTSSSPRTLTIVAGCETFTVNQNGVAAANPVPVLTSLQPSSTAAGSGAFTLTVNGSNFITTSSVNFNGVPRATTFLSATQVTAAILATDIASAGTPAVTVTNPSPGGGTSNALTFTITGPAAPAASLSPTTVAFPNTAVGSSATAQTVTLSNTGAAALTISGITIVGAHPADFSQTNTCGSSLAAGSHCSISVTFTPASVASFTATLSVADNATGSPQTVTLTGTGTTAPAPVVSLTPPSLSFSAQSGTTSAAQAATLKNTGNAALTISGISIAGTNPTDFAQTNTCGASLAAGASCSISVTFKPASAASFAATVSVADNATGSPHTIALTGTGTAGPAPAVSLTPASLSFSAQSGTTSAAQAVTLKNTGAAALTVTGISIAGTNPTDFAQTSTCGASLAAGASCSISVTFKPASAASFAATLTVADNSTGSPHTVTLTGTGTAAPAPAVSLTPTSLTFSSQSGVTSAPQSVTLKNTGDAVLNITGVSLAGANPADFAETSACGTTLAAGSSCSISVTFTPAAAASFAATLSIADNATGSPHAVTLTGTGTAAPAPAVSLTPTSLTFSAQTSTSSPTQPVTLKNTGNASLTITGITLAGANPAVFAETNACGGSLAAGSTCVITVTFTPTAVTTYTATLSIADNATGSPQTVTLSGTGTPPPAPVVSLTPASLTFTAQTGATSAAQSATLKNTGNATLSINGITLGGTGAADFAQTNNCGETLAAGATCAISLTFTPASAASFTATLSVADNAAGSPHTISLTGTGTVPPPPTFTITSATTAQTVQSGGSAQYSITVTPQNGTYSNPVTFAASGLPPGATATFSPTSVTPGSAAASTQLTIQTAAQAAAASMGTGWPLAATVLPLLGLLFSIRKFRRRWVTIAVLLFASLGALIALSGCGGGFGLKTSTSYSITVTGTSGEIQQSTTVQLTVQ